MNILIESMLRQSDPDKVAGLSRFFKSGPGQYGEGDKFLGIKVPTTREVVKSCWQSLSFDDLEECLESEFHELRFAGLIALVMIYRHARKDQSLRGKCVQFYLSHISAINNWDLVDLSCYEILGDWLMDKDRSILYDLARNGKTIWERRIGIVSTMAFARKGQLDDTYAIADIFLEDGKDLHDLLQKAVGWLVREVGERDMDRLRAYLAEEIALPGKPDKASRVKQMPRTMLRYAIEKFPEDERKSYLSV